MLAEGTQMRGTMVRASQSGRYLHARRPSLHNYALRAACAAAAGWLPQPTYMHGKDKESSARPAPALNSSAADGPPRATHTAHTCDILCSYDRAAVRAHSLPRPPRQQRAYDLAIVGEEAAALQVDGHRLLRLGRGGACARRTAAAAAVSARALLPAVASRAGACLEKCTLRVAAFGRSCHGVAEAPGDVQGGW